MRSVDIDAMGSNPEAFYDMCIAAGEPVAIMENGEWVLVAMSGGAFNEIKDEIHRCNLREADRKTALMHETFLDA
ncbi:hypothetical protein [Enorma phocaeensis]|uniref:hypothetical protein n=1 Tax=Enorma phocaeensis TaxID=1871019 RepID=UPI000C848C8A|nr:hypothetical protein [Enorma phocaeensis]